VILLRHPRPDAPAGLCYGRTDVGTGSEAAGEIAAAVAKTPPVVRVIASPARRCRALAEALAGRDGVVLAFDDRLWEMDFGDWEGMMWDDIHRADSDAWADDPWNVAPPGGETFAAVHARVRAALDGLAPGTAVVAHAGPIRAARMLLQGLSFASVFAEPVPYARPLLLKEPV
jgi:alpha-ribazole phosphatase